MLIKQSTGLSSPLCNVRGINSSPLVAAFTIYSPAIDSLSCANLFDKSKGELNGQEQTQLSELLCEFEDVFAKSEFDLGKFNTIQHGIDTGANRPVKQRIGRTPLGFAIPYIPG
jgi:hypothetical protein